MADILILRPEGKCAQSQTRFQQAGLPALAAPLLKITANPSAIDALSELLGDAQTRGHLIVVSTHAAELALQALGDNDWPQGLQLYAVGRASATALNTDKPVQIPDQEDSEGLLGLASLADLHDQPVYLLKGEGGRPLLGEQLRHRGAKVQPLDLYKREPNLDWQPETPIEDARYIVATSGSLIEAAFARFDHEWLQGCQWLVVSERTAEIARQLGATQVIISKSAQDQDLIEATQRLWKPPMPETTSTSSDTETTASPQPRQPSTPEQQPKAAVQQIKPAKTGGLWLLSLLNTLLILAIAGGAYWWWQQNQQEPLDLSVWQQQLDTKVEQQALTTRINGLQAQLQQQLKQQQNAQQQGLEQQISAFSSELSQLGQQIQANRQRFEQLAGRRPSDWLVAEANFLVKMAGRKLYLEQDVNTALLMLSAADTRLQSLDDPSLLPVRTALAADQQQLRNLQRRPHTQMALQIGALIQRADDLPLRLQQLPDLAVGQSAELSDSISDWRANLAASWDRLMDDFIRVQSRDENLQVQLTESQQWWLREQFKFNLLQAQVALLQNQPELFKQQLSLAQDLLSDYYALEQNTVQQALNQLGKLRQTSIAQNYPSQLTSSTLLDEVLAERIQTLPMQEPQP